MSENIKERNLPVSTPASVDYVRTVKANGLSGLARLTDLPLTAPQQAALDSMQAQVDSLNAGTIAESTWARLISLAPGINQPVGAQASIPRASDPGSHVDPIKDGDQVVPNGGLYVRRTTAANGWEWLQPDVLAEKANKTDLLDYSTIGYTGQQLSKVDFMVYEGDGPVVPVVSDDGLKVLLGVDTETGKIVGDISSESVVPVLAETFPADMISQEYQVGDPVAVVSDAGNRVMLGVDTTNGEIIGRLPMPVQGTLLPQGFSVYKPARDAGWLHYIHYGQSLGQGAWTSSYSVVQGYANLTFGAGLRATKAGSTGQNPGTNTIKPLVEDGVDNDGSTAARGETGIMAATDEVCERQLESGKSLPVFFGSAAGHVSYAIADLGWTSAWSQVFRDHVDEAKARAAEYGYVYDLPVVMWVQGEANSSSTVANYLNALRNLQQSISNYVARPGGREVPFLMYQTPRNNISRAQFVACDDYDAAFMHSTAIYDCPSEDGTHLTAFGYHKFGRRNGRALNDILNGLRPRAIWPKGAVRRGGVIRWSFEVPTAPLVLNTDDIAAITDSGFSVAVNDAIVSLASIQLDGSDVVLTLVAAPADSDVVEVRYGYDHALTGHGWSAGNTKGGNVMDSTTDTFWYAGLEYPLPYLMPHCHRSVTNLKTGANGQ